MNDRLSGKSANGLYLGVDAGSVSVNAVLINGDGEIVFETPYKRHFGRVEQEVHAVIHQAGERFGEENIRSVSFTGAHGKRPAEKMGAGYEFETISQILGVLAIVPDVRTIISMGGQDSSLFQIHHDNGHWELAHFKTNGPCASGTGSFIDQQAERLATALYEKKKELSQDQIDRILADFIRLGLKSERPANVACRCTVFTKSDMIHLQNKGEKLQDIIHGLHVGNARNYISTIVSNQQLEEPIVFVGGLSLNALQVKAFRRYFPNLTVPPLSTSTGALGAAFKALESQRTEPLHRDAFDAEVLEKDGNVARAPRLELNQTDLSADTGAPQLAAIRPSGTFLGIDIGSTTTKYALIDSHLSIIDKRYVPTRGKPIEVTQQLLAGVRDKFGSALKIRGAATTGSGRSVVGDFLNADLIVDEITAHARGAVEIDRQVDTIFEIGGQDSKYIQIVNTHPLDFDMNKVCAAGTGSFLHELASKYGVNIVDEFQQIALSSESPVKLAERCTVFMESDLVAYYQKGIAQNDLFAGLCYAIVYNYLNRVVGKRSIGRRVMFLGGPSLNKAVVAAFEIVLGRGLIVPPHREVLGAFGAAVMLREKMQTGSRGPGRFRGLTSAIDDRLHHKEKICKADAACHNQCKLKIYDFGGRRSIWGGECGRYEGGRQSGSKKTNYFDKRQMLWEEHLAGVAEVLEEKPVLEVNGRPTVGLHRSLYMHQTGILWAHFFDALGFQPVFTPPTNTPISRTGIEHAEEGVCFPVKVFHGHIRELIDKTRYLFLPSLLNMPTARDEEIGRYCPMVMSSGYMARMALNVSPSALLNPSLHMKYHCDALAAEMTEQLKPKLGLRRGIVKEALQHGLDKQERFSAELLRCGKAILARRSEKDPLIVVSGRPYNLYDERLNLRLGRNLARIGIDALPLDFIDIDAVDLSDFPSMFWGLGARILRSARWVKQHPYAFGLHLTNFSCGADSFLEHFYKHIMGEKAYLILELDEHSAVAGVMTRLEAFKNVIENSMNEAAVAAIVRTESDAEGKNDNENRCRLSIADG
jgi:predicted CoA-substrate-specific enzyme activase